MNWTDIRRVFGAREWLVCAAGLLLAGPGVADPARGEDAHPSSMPSAGADTTSTDLAAGVAKLAVTDSAAARAEEAWLDETATLIGSLLDGGLSGDFVVQSLFEVDLLDESAVSRRRETLQMAILDRTARLEGRTAPDSTTAPADSLAVVGADSSGGAAGADTTAGARDRLTRLDPATSRILEKRNLVDRLRLEFLRLPAEQRTSINETERRRRRLLAEKEDAQRARREAELAAVEAEERRRQALEEAQRKQSARLELLTSEIARAETFNSSLARLGAELATRREEEVERANAGLQSTLELARSLETSDAGADDIWVIYVTVAEQLARVRPLLRKALDEWTAPSDVPTFVPALDVTTIRDSTVAEQVAMLRNLYWEIASSRSLLLDTEKSVRAQILEYRLDRVKQCRELRVRALGKLPAHRRGQVLGLTRHGLRALAEEIDQLSLSARVYLVTRLRSIDRIPGRLDDVFALGTATYIALRTLLVAFLVVFIHRRSPALVARVRQLALIGVRDPQIRQRVERVLASIGVGAPWLYFLASVVALRWAIGEAAHWTELFVLFRALIWYGLYRLVLAYCFRLIVSLSERQRFNKEPKRLVKLFTTLRAVLRVALVIAIFLLVSERWLGRGFLYYLAANLAWMGGVGVVLGLLHGWREIICEAYVSVRPEGRLSEAVRKTRDRWYGFVVGGAAFVWLAGRAGLMLARDFALGFDQVRKALAFLFRKRIEKRAEAQGYAEGLVEELPHRIIVAFEEVATNDPRLIVENFPGLSDLQGAIDAWCESGTRGTFLLTGERGMGKSSWLKQVHDDRVQTTIVPLERRVGTTAELWSTLVEQLAPEVDPGLGMTGLSRALVCGEPRIVVVDGCHNLFLGTVGGYEVIEAFAALADATRTRVFWLCSANVNAWAHLEAVRPDFSLFSYRTELRPWSEEQIRQLIETRTRAAGISLSYEDLLTDSIEESDGHTESDYMRLLWDYADGNPRVALHFWLRSLVLGERGGYRVRLFRTPAGDALAAVGEIGMFLLASIVLHENLTVEEAAAATRYKPSVCRSTLDRLEEEGILEKRDQRYRLATYWHRAVIRQLRRGNMLAHSAAA